MRPHPASLFQPAGPDNKSDGVCRAGSFYLAAIRKELGSVRKSLIGYITTICILSVIHTLARPQSTHRTLVPKWDHVPIVNHLRQKPGHRHDNCDRRDGGRNHCSNPAL